jgi:hypothetical protein
MSVKESLINVEIAFKQLEFSIKLMCYCENGHLSKNEFDTDVLILLEQENRSFLANNFSDYNEIVVSSQINVGITFGATAIVLDSLFEEAGIKRDPNATDSVSELRTFIYMVRCAFAHNIASPEWNARGNFNKVYNLDLMGERKSIDIRPYNGVPFEYGHIGGFSNWFKVKEESRRVINGS